MSNADYLALGPAARFWSKVDKSGTCWLWTGGQYGDGYGKFSTDGVFVAAHRFAWDVTHGWPVPADLTIDHLCRVRLCVNPSHMEVVTRGENSRRGGGSAIAAANARARTHCKHGHAFTPENTYRDPKHGNRGCRTCRIAAARTHRKAAAVS